MPSLFTKIIQREIPAHILYEDDATIAFLDIHPINPGHTLVVPKREAENILASSDEDIARLMQTVRKITPAILETVHATGFNLGVNTGADAGQVILHTHIHIIPRFANDGHRHWHGKDTQQEELAELAQKLKIAIGS